MHRNILQRISRFSLRHQLCFTRNSTVHLLNRSLLKISGEETVPFLQGLVSNDVRHLLDNNQTSVTLPCIYTLMLNLQGRVLYDVFLYNVPGSDSKAMWLECDSSVAEDIVKLLKKYRVRKKIDIGLVTDLKICATFNESSEAIEDIKTSSLLFSKDPRYLNIGHRVISESKHTIPNTCDLNTYIEHRLSLGIGEGTVDHPIADCFPLEINGDYLHGVSFFKGCYVGQELTSRTYHLGVVRKRLMPIVFDKLPEMEIAKGTLIVNEKGKSVGKYRYSVNKKGIALLRIQEVLNAKELMLKDVGAVTTFEPDWWPKKETCRTFVKTGRYNLNS